MPFQPQRKNRFQPLFAQTLALTGIVLAGNSAFSQVAPIPQLKPQDAATPQPSMLFLPLLEPLWTSTTTREESLFFIQSGDGLPTAHLLFAPMEVFSLQSATGEVNYLEGQDYLVDRQKKTVTLPKGSCIPFKTAAQIRPPEGSPNTIPGAGTPEHRFLWNGGRLYHDLQSKITYSHAPNEWQGFVPAYEGELLPRTIQKLRAKEPLNLVVLGDSISVGMSASSLIGAQPQMPAYSELVRQQLERKCGGPVNLTLVAVGGKTTEWGLKQTTVVVAAKPDLVIIAFGMNDSGSLTPPAYLVNTSEIIKRIQADLPQAEFVLVGSSLPNPDWQARRNKRLLSYESGLKKMSGPGIAFADVTAVWTELLKHKNYLELTGNGINHPNDFGHRLYAQTLVALLTKDSAPA